MHLNCPDCKHEIHSDDVNIVRTIAKCKECHNIFSFAKELEEAPLPVPVSRKDEIFVIPDGIEVLRMMEELEILVNWKESGKSFLLFFSLLWNGILVFITLMMLFASGSAIFELIFPLLFLIPFFAVGAYTLYEGLAYLVNKTYISIDHREIWIEHKPMNLFRKDQYIDNRDIKQVYVKRYEIGKQNNRPIYGFMVSADLKDGSTIQIIKNLKKATHGKFIEQEIERFLNIKNEPITGEWT